jgi:hypothetical protein
VHPFKDAGLVADILTGITPRNVVHFCCDVRDVFNNAYYDQWIVRGGPTALPPSLPDFEFSGF